MLDKRSHNYAAYAFPNDEQEQERLALQGPILTRLMGGKLFYAPLSAANPPRYVLDIATGVGDWAIDMADEFPDTTVIATDLSPIQPVNVPPNLRFYIEDAYVILTLGIIFTTLACP
jgi:tRNA G46 methylase TrmB